MSKMVADFEEYRRRRDFEAVREKVKLGEVPDNVAAFLAIMSGLPFHGRRPPGEH